MQWSERNIWIYFAVHDVLPLKNKYFDVNIYSHANKHVFMFTVYRLCGKGKP